MKKRLIRLGMIEVVCLILGVLSGGVRMILGNRSLFWRPLETPPSKAVRIVDGDYLAVRVKTASGETYFCRINSWNQCWIHNDHPLYSPYTFDTPISFRIFHEPPALSGVVDSKRFYTELSEYSTVLAVYAVTETGKVYVWRDGLAGSFDFVAYGFQGIVVALLCGLVYWGVFEW